MQGNVSVKPAALNSSQYYKNVLQDDTFTTWVSLKEMHLQELELSNYTHDSDSGIFWNTSVFKCEIQQKIRSLFYLIHNKTELTFDI